jgi:hypothetical protein
MHGREGLERVRIMTLDLRRKDIILLVERKIGVVERCGG